MNSVMSNHTRDHEVGSSVEWPSIQAKEGFSLATGGRVTSENGEVEVQDYCLFAIFLFDCFALFIKTCICWHVLHEILFKTVFSDLQDTLRIQLQLC